MNLSESILDLIGNTPLIKLNSLASGFKPEVYVKGESYNPSGSIKDRVAINIIKDAESRGVLKPGDTIVEATSGNMGAALALIGTVKGYRCILTLPETTTREKIQVLKLFGAEVILTPKGLSPSDEQSCYEVARRTAGEKNAFYVNQYFNSLNPDAHYKTTGLEIWRDTQGSVDTVICGIGTGGTITGVGKYLKERKAGIRVIGVEPVGSVFKTYLETGAFTTEAPDFSIEGIGKNFIPGALDLGYVDDVIQVYEQDAFHWQKDLLKREGILVGPSSGAAIDAAIRYARDNDKDEYIVVILPDAGSKYLSRYAGIS